MRILCICAKADPMGYFVVAGRPLSPVDLSSLTGKPQPEVETLLVELGQYGVFSTDRKGRIYNRRMVRDVQKSRTAVQNGKLGGNPTLSKQTGNSASDNPTDKPPDKPHKPEASNQKKKPPGASAPGSKEPPAVPDWVPQEPWEGWLEMRRQARAPNTPHALRLALAELTKLREAGQPIVDVINRATLKGWKSFYAISGASETRKISAVPTLSPPDEWRRKVKQFKDRGVWLSVDGPPPSDPGNSVPSAILDEFGYGRQAA